MSISLHDNDMVLPLLSIVNLNLYIVRLQINCFKRKVGKLCPKTDLKIREF